MPERVSLLMREFLSWIHARRRTYADAMLVWRSTCPRHTVWEDALIEGFVRIEHGDRLAQSEVVLTPLGRTILDLKADP